jgi:hypothetical protein
VLIADATAYDCWLMVYLFGIVKCPRVSAARRDPPEFDRAQPHYRRALAPADAVGMRPL